MMRPISSCTEISTRPVPVRYVAEKNAQAWQTQPDLPHTDAQAPHQNGQTQI